MIWSKRFWQDLTERAIRAAAGSLVGLWVTGAGFSLFSIDWKASLGVAGAAAVFSVVSSLFGSRIGDKGTPSLLPAQLQGRHELHK